MHFAGEQQRGRHYENTYNKNKPLCRGRKICKKRLIAMHETTNQQIMNLHKNKSIKLIGLYKLSNDYAHIIIILMYTYIAKNV